MQYRAQGAIEYLLIIGAAILVVAIVILAVTGVLSGGQSQTSVGLTSVGSSFDALRESNKNFIRLNNYYYTKSDPMVSSLATLWHLDGSQGNTFSDSSPNNLDMTCDVGHCPPQVNGLWGTATEFGSITHGQANDGNFLYVPVTSTSPLNFGKNDFTISLWFNTRDKPNGGNNADTLISWGWFDQPDPRYGRFLCWFDWGNLGCFVTNGGYQVGVPSYGISYPGANINLNQWYHLVFLRRGDTVVGYINGVPFGTAALPAGYDIGSNPANPWPLMIGAEARKGYVFNGYISEVSIWNRALSDADVNALFVNATS
ncbi:MAG: LamG-like jellyroll fold domain-containing protein [archaeon]